VIKPVCLRKM